MLLFKSRNLFFALFSLLIFSSCSNKKDNLSLLPKNSEAVMVIDVFSIIKKGELDKLDNLKSFRSFQTEIRNEDRETSLILDEILENPRNLGIDLQADVFVYLTEESDENNFYNVALSLSNEKKFENFLGKIFDLVDQDFIIQKSQNFKYVLTDGGFIGWDKSRAISSSSGNDYLSNREIENELSKAFNLNASRQISASKQFKEFYNNKKDISLWFSSNLLEDNYQYNRLNNDLNLNDNYLSAHLNFKKNAIAISSTFLPNKDFKHLIEDNGFYDNSFNTELLKFLPKQNLGLASISINPMAYYNFFKEEYSSEALEVDSELRQSIGMSLQDVFKSIDGNAVFSVIGYDKVEKVSNNSFYNRTYEEDAPIIAMVLEINDNKLIKKFISELSNEVNLIMLDGFYQISEPPEKIYFNFNEDILLVTNDKTTVERFSTGGFNSNSLANSPFESSIVDNHFYSQFPLNLNDYPLEIQRGITREIGEPKLLYMWDDLLKNVELKQVDETTVEFAVNFENSNENSLRSLIKTIDDSYVLSTNAY